MKASVQTILVVEDEKSMRALLRTLFEEEGYAIEEAVDGIDALNKVRERFFDLILLDLKMPKMDGMEALREIKKINPGIPVLMMTAYATIRSAVEAMKLGAYDYITKPFNNEEIRAVVRSILEYRRFSEKGSEPEGGKYLFNAVVGRSNKVHEVFQILRRVSPTNATVLIFGESGTGKELIAQAIHHNSLRAGGPFLAVNCASLPESLLESELFGHEKGAFTNAYTSKEGRFELSDKGTIFLDEIGDLSLTTQAKLLRVIQEKEFERVGGTRTIKVDVRIISATNKDLAKEVEGKKFREDLFYRLNVIAITLPPLRERKEDIREFVEYFLKKFNAENKKQVEEISPRALDLLMRYHWPGNIRELENA
ncbi:MAG: sigma-54 dependent transcriptional regulator, partial [Deltaproteobacteria bacterium]|nr:sigma-54 dependent transcriptional regulator [Deltaproteobacteria bacterium]